MPKFITIVRGSEKHGEPPPALFAAIDQLIKDAGKRLVGVGGLLSSAKGARARLAKGKGVHLAGRPDPHHLRPVASRPSRPGSHRCH